MRALSAAISSRQIAAAAPNPTIPGMLSVPDRMPRSCPPPLICSASSTRGFRRRT